MFCNRSPGRNWCDAPQKESAFSCEYLSRQIGATKPFMLSSPGTKDTSLHRAYRKRLLRLARAENGDRWKAMKPRTDVKFHLSLPTTCFLRRKDGNWSPSELICIQNHLRKLSRYIWVKFEEKMTLSAFYPKRQKRSFSSLHLSPIFLSIHLHIFRRNSEDAKRNPPVRHSTVAFFYSMLVYISKAATEMRSGRVHSSILRRLLATGFTNLNESEVCELRRHGCLPHL